MVSAIAGANAVRQVGDPTQGQLDKQQLANDLDDFLTLLLVQLENQDPTEPMDANQFTEQIVQLSGVEQSINTNTNLEKLIALQETTFNSDLISLTGRRVEIKGSRLELNELADGSTSASMAYKLPDDVKDIDKVFVQVFDDAGNPVFTGEGTTTAGRNTVTWDGLNNDGEQVPAGLYNVVVSTRTHDGNVENIDAFVGGTVEGVNLAAETPTLVINGQEVTLEEVNFIGNPS